jgi:hypothetical protein
MNKNWKTALAAMGITPKIKKQPDMLFEIDDANGVKLSFPDANDATEVVEGAKVNVADGEYTFEVDSVIHTITVADGVVTAKSSIDKVEASSEMNAETKEFLQAVANEFENTATMLADLKKELTQTKTDLVNMKALIKHSGDQEKPDNQVLNLGGKKIDLNKINLK